MTSKVESGLNLLAGVLHEVSGIIKASRETGENSINKRDNNLEISVNFSFGEKGCKKSEPKKKTQKSRK